MTTINKLIKDNRDIILNTEKNHLRNQKTLTEEDFCRYEGFLREEIYQQINYIFIALETRKCTIIEKTYLIEQIPLLSQLLFDYLNGEKDDYWRVTQQEYWDYMDYDYTFIQPKDFTKEYVNQRLSLLIKPQNKPQKESTKPIKQEPKAFINETWFIVSLALATGRVDELKAKNKSWEYISNNIQKDEDNKLFFGYDIKPRKMANWISKSWLNDKTKNEITDPDNYRKNIFARIDVDEEMDIVITYCINNNLTIRHKDFVIKKDRYKIKHKLFEKN